MTLLEESQMQKAEYLSLAEVGKILGVSRIAIYKKVRKGEIKAIRIGRAFAVPRGYIAQILGKALSKEAKAQIDKAVKKAVKEYGETLKLLGRE